MSEVWDAAVVGAGPAGSAAAAILAQDGRRVLLLEKDRFPRPKVCGEFLSADAEASLARLGVRERLQAAGPERIDRGAIHLPRGARVDFRFEPPAAGVSRYLLDDLLACRAAELGARVRFGARVASVSRTPDRYRLALAGGEEILSRLVVGAWGRWDALDRRLERRFQRRRRRYFGWSRDFEGDTTPLSGRVGLYLFRGGYCGLSRVERGTANLAGIVSEERYDALGGWAGVLDGARRENRPLDAELGRLEPGPVGLLATGPVFFTAKPPSEDGMLMAGDAAGVIDPFSGEGQAAALASGILAGETAVRALAGRIAREALAGEYASAWRARFGRRFTWSSVFRELMLRPAAASVAARLAGPALVRFAISTTRR